jgi:hypothetical protein
MADQRHIIDVILRARDNTAAAVREATANLKGFEEVNKRVGEEQTRQNQAAQKSYSELNREISVSQQKYGGFIRQIAESKGITKEQVDQVVKLEGATRNYVKALSDENATAARRAQSLGALRSAQEDLNDSLVESSDLSKAQAKAISDEIVARQKQIEQAQQLQRVQAQAHREITAQIDERRRKQEELNRTLDKSDREAAQRREQENREIQQLEANRQKLIDERIRKQEQLNQILNKSDREAQQRREQELRDVLRIENERKKVQDERIRSQNELNRILDRSDREASVRREQENRELQALLKSRRDAAAEQERQRERELNLGRQYIAQIEQAARLERERNQARETGDFTTEVKLDFDAAAARAQAAEVAAGLRALFDHIEANITLNDAEFQAHATQVLAMKALLEKHVKIDVDLDIDAADIAKVNALSAAVRDVDRDSRTAGGGMGFLSGLVKSVGDGFDGSSQRIASFDNYLRGLMSLGIALFLNQLILLAGAAAGSLAALASSAAMAGGAVGGGLLAGLAQALPVIGLFAAAMYRFKAVMDAANQAQLLQQQQSYKGTQQARQQATAADQVKSAQERVADSLRRVASASDQLRDSQDGVAEAQDKATEAQKKVNEARRQAAERLRDLILQERGLNLSMEENENATRRAASRGQTGALPALFLRRDEIVAQRRSVTTEISERTAGNNPEVDQAEAGVDSALKGVEAARKAVENARESLRDANRSVDQSKRGLDSAKRSADQADAAVTAASGKLAFLLSRMSDAERHLYETVKNLQDVFRGAAQTVTEPLIVAFDEALQKITRMLQDPRILSAFTSLSEEMAVQGTRFFDHLTSPESINTFLGFIEEAKKNLAPLTDIIIHISDAFIDIAVAAGPALSAMIDWVDDITGKIADFFDTGRKSGELTDFFDEGVVHLKAWGDLLWQIVRLFAAIAGPGGGARTGLELVNDMADGIRGWADAISDPDSKINAFFQRFFKLSKQMMEAMAPVFTSIAREINKTFTEDGLTSVEGFANFLADVLIPAIGGFARTLGGVTAKVGEFTKANPEIAKMAASFLAATLTFGVLTKAMTIFGPLISVFKFLGKYMLDALGVTEKLLGPMVEGARTGGLLASSLRTAAGIILGPWGIAIGLFVLLAVKLGLLHDLVDALKRPFVALWEQVEPPLMRAKDAFQGLFDAVSEGSGAFAVLRPVLKIVIDLLGIFLEGIGRAIGKVLGGLIDVIAGVVDVLTGLLTGDFGQVWKGLKEIVTGAVRAVIGVLELVFLRGDGPGLRQPRRNRACWCWWRTSTARATLHGSDPLHPEDAGSASWRDPEHNSRAGCRLARRHGHIPQRRRSPRTFCLRRHQRRLQPRLHILQGSARQASWLHQGSAWQDRRSLPGSWPEDAGCHLRSRHQCRWRRPGLRQRPDRSHQQDSAGQDLDPRRPRHQPAGQPDPQVRQGWSGRDGLRWRRPASHPGRRWRVGDPQGSCRCTRRELHGSHQWRVGEHWSWICYWRANSRLRRRAAAGARQHRR